MISVEARTPGLRQSARGNKVRRTLPKPSTMKYGNNTLRKRRKMPVKNCRALRLTKRRFFGERPIHGTGMRIGTVYAQVDQTLIHTFLAVRAVLSHHSRPESIHRCSTETLSDRMFYSQSA